MNMEHMAQLLISEPAILIYEFLVMVVLAVCIILLSKERKKRMHGELAALEQQARQSLDDSIANERRRQV